MSTIWWLILLYSSLSGSNRIIQTTSMLGTSYWLYLNGCPSLALLGLVAWFWMHITMTRWNELTRDIIWWGMLWMAVFGLVSSFVTVSDIMGQYILLELLWMTVLATLARYGTSLMALWSMLISWLQLLLNFLVMVTVAMADLPVEEATLGPYLPLYTVIWILMVSKLLGMPVLLIALGMYSSVGWWLLSGLAIVGYGVAHLILAGLSTSLGCWSWTTLAIGISGLWVSSNSITRSLGMYEIAISSSTNSIYGMALLCCLLGEGGLIMGLSITVISWAMYMAWMYWLCWIARRYLETWFGWTWSSSIWWRMAGIPPTMTGIIKGWAICKSIEASWMQSTHMLMVMANTTSCLLLIRSGMLQLGSISLHDLLYLLLLIGLVVSLLAS